MKTRNAILLAVAAVAAYRYRTQLKAFVSSFGAKKPTSTSFYVGESCSPPAMVVNGVCTQPKTGAL